MIKFLVLALSFPSLALAQTDCTQVVSKLRDFTTRVNDNNYAVATFVGEVSMAMDGWYADYSQFENSTVSIAQDYFVPLRDAADGIGQTVNVAYDNLDILDRDGQAVVAEVEECLAATAAPLAPTPPAALTP